MLKIEVASSYVKQVTGSKGENAGKQFQIPMVEVYAHLADEKYPVRCDYSLGKGQQAPSAGAYFIGPRSFYVNEYGQLGVRKTLDLIPIPVKQPA